MQSAAPAALPSGVIPKDSRQLPCLLLSSLLLLLLLHLLSPPLPPSHRLRLRRPAARRSPIATALSSAGPAPPPSHSSSRGSAGDADRLLRLLLATYHPRNLYLLLLDRAASDADRARLARKARTGPGRPNVHIVGDSGFANPRGASALAETLHGAALLLQLGQEWDWFVPLDAADYPLVTPDGDSSILCS
ncbi:hypothetical protein PR202_gb18581 [Eleusine coracana subsp. coracana]|uniref:Uncharacterized protein n=1 Tax=Eleusine coracana subsp. coracana TaxID=191504 RepID=A0AAV5F604_ELECO|nr:hypothetical protein PR202_gb18581 [Eleusine coracana subsp. coracana]